MKNQKSALSKMTITGALRSVLKQMGVKTHMVYSDSRKPGGVKAVGAKFVNVKLSKAETAEVIKSMTDAGFVHHYIRWNVGTGYYSHWSNGTRFCFSKP